MDNVTFSVGSYLKKGWELTKANIGFLLGYQIILVFLSLILGATRHKVFLYLLVWVIVIIAKMGLYKAALLITNGIKPRFDELYANWRSFFPWVIASFLFSIMFFVGLGLLIFPGCYVLATFGLFPYFLLDRKLGPIEALKRSARATKGFRWNIFLLFLACIGINLVGMLVLVVGLLITIPITMLALAVLYQEIQGRAYREETISGPEKTDQDTNKTAT